MPRTVCEASRPFVPSKVIRVTLVAPIGRTSRGTAMTRAGERAHRVRSVASLWARRGLLALGGVTLAGAAAVVFGQPAAATQDPGASTPPAGIVTDLGATLGTALTPVTQGVVQPAVDAVVAPALQTVVTPAVTAAAPVVETVTTQVAEPVVAAVVETVVVPVATAVTPVVQPVVAVARPVVAPVVVPLVHTLSPLLPPRVPPLVDEALDPVLDLLRPTVDALLPGAGPLVNGAEGALVPVGPGGAATPDPAGDAASTIGTTTATESRATPGWAPHVSSSVTGAAGSTPLGGPGTPGTPAPGPVPGVGTGAPVSGQRGPGSSEPVADLTAGPAHPSGTRLPVAARDRVQLPLPLLEVTVSPA